MAQFVKTIQNFAFQNNLWEKDSRIIIGVSGGSDSVSLLDVLCRLAPKYNLELHIAHVNYGLRGKDSVADEHFVKILAEKYKLPISILRPKKADYKGNLENSLRKIRYDFFAKLRNELNFDLTAVAHNQDDQAETVLMRMIRGAGLSGLSAMKAKSGSIIRPLLQTGKNDILAYVKENKLKYRNDKSNSDLKFTRNMIRHELIPYLEKKFNPSIKKTLSDWSLSVADDYEYIENNAQFLLDLTCKNKCASFGVEKFLSQPVAIQRQGLRTIFDELKGGMQNVESGQIEEILKIVKSGKGKAQKAAIGGLKISRKGDRIEIFC